MSIRSLVRPNRSRIRRLGATAVVVAGLSVSAGGVVLTSSVSAAPSAPSTRTATLSQVVGLRYGSVGEPVRQLQQALVRVGVGVRYGIDGVFGSATRASVKAWQGHRGLPVTGVVDRTTGRSLGFVDPAPTPAGSGTTSSSGAGPILGNRGAAVARLQLALINHGYVPPGGVDGLFGGATRDALKRFQRAKGLAVTGVADAPTMRALGLAGSGTPASPAPPATTTAPPASASGVLARGSRGAAVAEIQRQLISKGFAVAGGADGIFGPATEAAVKQFQRSKGLTQSGRVDAATRAALAAGGGTPAAPPAANGSSGYVGLRLGSSGPKVVDLQRALQRFGWVVRGGADGYFGAATQSVLRTFQRTNGAPQTGVLDAASAQVLGLGSSTNPAVPNSPAVPGTTASGFAAYDERGPRVVALQQALIRHGLPVKGGADGVFGSATAGSVMAFQRAKGLPATGKVDATTAQRLGLQPIALPTPAAPAAVRLEAKPVQGPCYYGDTWGFARSGGRSHLGVDILAAEGRQLYAVATGTISQIYVDRPGSLSGNGLKITRADGTYFFYAHLSRLAPGIKVGTKVTAGQLVGYVGKTGNTIVSHLHLEIHPGGGAAVNPYPIVKAFGAC